MHLFCEQTHCLFLISKPCPGILSKPFVSPVDSPETFQSYTLFSLLCKISNENLAGERFKWVRRRLWLFSGLFSIAPSSLRHTSQDKAGGRSNPGERPRPEQTSCSTAPGFPSTHMHPHMHIQPAPGSSSRTDVAAPFASHVSFMAFSSAKLLATMFFFFSPPSASYPPLPYPLHPPHVQISA